MRMSIEAYSSNSKPEEIEEIFKKYAIDMMKKISDYGAAMGEEPLNFEAIGDDGWAWITEDSPIEIVDAVSWGWRVRHDGFGAAGNCIFYVNAPVVEEAKGRTVFSMQHHGKDINLDITVE